jgi:tRNA threonylcarbamoyl adenosine modification protein (Sua5/YciO/YrdC/YwlC family)
VWVGVHAALRHGDLVILPTETVYGLGADPRQPAALHRLYAAKQRPEEKAIARLAADLDQVRADGTNWSPLASELAERFWPGAMTLILDTAGGAVGYRIPDFPATRDLLRRFGRVLAVTSANRSGEPPAVTAEEAVRAVGSFAAVVLDAGPAPGGVASTVIRVAGERFTVLREGALSRREVETALGKVDGLG